MRDFSVVTVLLYTCRVLRFMSAAACAINSTAISVLKVSLMLAHNNGLNEFEQN